MTHGSFRILYVEDDLEHAALLRESLADLPARVDVAPTGDAAIELLASAGADPFQLVVLDMFVPRSAGDAEVDEELGLRLLIDLQSSLGLIPRDVPVIVFTANESYDLCNRCLLAGANYFLPKTDLRSDQNNYVVLAKVCRTLLGLEPPAQGPLADWLALNWAELEARHAGRVIALVPDGGPDGPSYRVALAASTLPDLRRQVLSEPGLRWQCPVCLVVPGASRTVGPDVSPNLVQFSGPNGRPVWQISDAFVHVARWSAGARTDEVVVQLAARSATGEPDEALFVLDTGAQQTFVTRQLATRLGLALSAEATTIHHANGSRSSCHRTELCVRIGADWVTVPALVPEAGTESVPANLLGMTGLLDRYMLCVALDGIDVFLRTQSPVD